MLTAPGCAHPGSGYAINRLQASGAEVDAAGHLAHHYCRNVPDLHGYCLRQPQQQGATAPPVVPGEIAPGFRWHRPSGGERYPELCLEGEASWPRM